METAMKSLYNEFKAALFIWIADKSSYKGVKTELDNLYLFNQEAYPKTLDVMLKYLQNYCGHDGVGNQQH